MQILQVTRLDEELVSDIRRLVRELDPDAIPPSPAHLQRVARSPGVMLLVARAGAPENRVVGMLTLVWHAIPTGIHSWIEDVVVEGEARGRGVGEALIRAGIERARREGAMMVDLTSCPEREAANRLYRRLGFQQRDTNVYRYLLTADR